MTGRRRTGDAGFTCLEVMFAAVVLAFAVIGLSGVLLQVRQGAAPGGVEATADHLLLDGVVWLRSLPRCDPDASVPSFGPEPGETRVDDVDDLAGVVEVGPQDRAGTTFSTDWRRGFRVQSVTVVDPGVAATGGSTSLLRVQVVVRYQNADVAWDTLLLARTP